VSGPNRSQGAFIFAKAKQGPEVVRESLAHLRRSLEAIFNQPHDTNFGASQSRRIAG
jgi:hypothetical protein